MEPADNVTFRISCRLQIRRLGGSMRKVSIVAPLLCYAVLVMLAQVSLAKAAQKGAAGAGTLSGSWLVTADFTGVPFYYRLELKQDGDKLTGDFGGDKLEGTLSGNAIHFVAKDEHSGTDELRGTVQGTTMSGTLVFTDPGDPSHPETHSFTAQLVPERRTGTPQRHEFTPTTFYRQFSSLNKPVLTVSPGDTVHTTTVDAGGTDEKGVTRVLGGNPETGPFYVETAAPGDTLVVHIRKLRLNRDWAISDDGIVDRATDDSLAQKNKDLFKNVRWHLDLAKGTGSPETPGEHLKNFSVPLRPMLGCVATAVGPAQAPPGTGDSGHFGGNMDFNEIAEGATVYLPV